jgi:hypothetical protein
MLVLLIGERERSSGAREREGVGKEQGRSREGSEERRTLPFTSLFLVPSF